MVYRIYVIGPDGHIVYRHEIEAENDDEARRQALTLGIGAPLEIWQAERLIAQLDGNGERTP